MKANLSGANFADLKAQKNADVSITYPLEVINSSGDWSGAKKGVGIIFGRGTGNANQNYGRIVGSIVSGDGGQGQVEIYTGNDVNPSFIASYASRLYSRPVGLGILTDTSITLAIGDTDTGLNWISDGVYDLYANNVAVARVDSSQLNVNVPLRQGGHPVWHTGSFNPATKANIAGDNFTGKVTISRDVGNTTSYNSGHLELYANAAGGNNVILGFHRGGATACSLVHDGEGLKLYGNGPFFDTLYGHFSAVTNSSYNSRHVRNTIMSTSGPSGGQNGDIWLQYV
jgi:hypothetical protein